MKTFDGVGLIFTTVIVIGVSLSKPHIDRAPSYLLSAMKITTKTGIGECADIWYKQIQPTETVEL